MCRRHTRGMTTGIGEPGERANAAGTDEVHYDIPSDTFSLRLSIARHHAGRLSIEQAAKLCGINPENWRRWEDGARPRDRIEVSQAISEALRMDLDWLMFGGPLLGARGRPAKRSAEDTHGYRRLTAGPSRTSSVRPRGSGPKVRTDGQRPISPAAPGRRAVRVTPIQIPEEICAA